MSAVSEARLSQLDRVLDAIRATPELAGELFAVADLLAAQPTLRNALADPSRAEADRQALVLGLLTSQVSPSTIQVVAEAVTLNWSRSDGLVAALERQGIRALLAHAEREERLDQVEDQLFAFSQVVTGNPELRQLLDDRHAPTPAKVDLVEELLRAKVDPDTLALAKRAAATSPHSIEGTLADYLELSAGLRQRSIAVVTVARALDADQERRLGQALVKQLGRKVNLQVVVDPSVVGGARVRVQDEVIEGTVSARLAAAEHQLS